ncbi:hypothetical protein YC2023_073496 [Brassica napus]
MIQCPSEEIVFQTNSREDEYEESIEWASSESCRGGGREEERRERVDSRLIYSLNRSGLGDKFRYWKDEFFLHHP